jgi:hypothetical protein
MHSVVKLFHSRLGLMQSPEKSFRCGNDFFGVGVPLETSFCITDPEVKN